MAFVLDTVMDQTISSSTPATGVNLQGYEHFSVLARLDGPAGSTVKMEVNNSGLLVATENITLNAGGWFNFFKRYEIFAPFIGIVLYNPSASMHVKMTVYAAGP